MKPCPEYLHGWNDCAKVLVDEADEATAAKIREVLAKVEKPVGRKLLRRGEVERMFGVSRRQVKYAEEKGYLKTVHHRPNSYPLYHVEECRRVFAPAEA